MSRRLTYKWRPPLSLVLGGALAGVLALPLIGYVLLRYVSAALVGTLVIGATLVLGYLLWRLILRPVTALSQRAEAIKTGDASAREPLQHYGTPELVALGQSVMDMAKTLHSREAGIRNYTDHITHELKTPLTAIRGAAELLGDGGMHTDEDQKLIESIQNAGTRMEHLLDAARKMAAARAPAVRGDATLNAGLASLQNAFPEMEIVVSGGDISLPLPCETLEIILRHLIENAAEHEASHVTITGQTDLSFTITDNGTGISTGNQPHVFDPFFTTKRESGGTGMGLNICRNMVQAQGGEITLQDSERGAKFLISF